MTDRKEYDCSGLNIRGIPLALRRKFRLCCMADGTTMTAATQEMIQMYIKNAEEDQEFAEELKKEINKKKEK